MKDAKGVSLREGSMVRARWKGGSQYFTGYVHNVDLDGTVSVQYDDGDFESDYNPDWGLGLSEEVNGPQRKQESPENSTIDVEKNESIEDG